MIVDAVERYVASIRAAGRSFRKDARRLANYAAFAQARGDSHVNTQSVLEWARRSSSALQRRRLVLLVRRFALAMAVEDPRHEAPPADVLPRAHRVRPKPYIYSASEIAALLAVADECATIRCPVPGQYRILFGLIAATGLRGCEALAIDVDDVTPEGLMVRTAKRGGRRLLPFHPTVETQLARHLRARVRVPADTEALFLADGRGRMGPSAARAVFRRMRSRTGLAGAREDGRNPRIHDLRHTFAVRSLEACGSGRRAVARHMVALSAWLGHASVAHTWWYHESTEALLGEVARRTEAFHGEDAS